jgi:hypothetical protein
LYWCETFSLTLREEHGLRVFESRVVRRIFGSKRNEVAGGWRRPYNEELHSLCASPDIVRVIKSRRMGWACSMDGTGKECIHYFGWKTLRVETTWKI